MGHNGDGQEAWLYWLALHLVPGLGTGNAIRILRKLGTPQAVFHASVTELEACGLRPAVAQSIASGVSFEDAAAELERVRAAGVEVVRFDDPRYPGPLKEIYDPPILLYARGRVELLSAFKIAVVGSRRPSPYGMAVAERLSRELATAGLVIASGMARGVDTAAHWGALKASGDTIAVLGCGIDVVYPAENRKLAAEIGERGLVVSEFPMGTQAFPQNFPIRNRILSGISSGVMVVEAAQYSGSLITARLALEQGREVFAVPGSIVARQSWGPNTLLKQGATLVQDWQDVVEGLPTPVRRMVAAAHEEKLADQQALGSGETSGGSGASELGELPRRLLGALRVEASVQLDELIQQLEEHSPSEIIASLCELEIAGHIRQLPGKNYVRVW